MPVNPEKKRCHAKSKHSGKQCSSWAVHGYTVCRMHGAGGATPEAEAKERRTLIPGGPPGTPPPPRPPLGHQRARKHGAYSARLLPDEQEVYEQVKAQFEAELGTENLSASDQRLIHQLAVFSAKFDCASGKDAPGEALQVLSRQVVEHLRELKATRATKEGGPSTGNTPAEVLAALYLKVTSARAIDPVAAAIPVNARRVEVLPAPESNNEDKE